jgi:Spy/CpxP family protein refolding chaperone
MKVRRLFCAALLILAGCAKAERAPLPGDSVSADGAVALTPARVPVVTSALSPVAPNAIEGALFPPELVMENQAAIKLTPAQHQTITEEVERTHAELLKTQWKLDAKKEELVATLDKERVDEAKSKDIAAELMKREIAITAGHLAMLVRIKNVLTAEQQAHLRAIGDADRCAAPRKGRDGGS